MELTRPLFIAFLCLLTSSFADAQVVRPNVAEVAAIERANESLSPTQAFNNLESKSGTWQVEGDVLVQSDRSALFARTFIEGPCWTNCIIKAKVRVDSVGEGDPSNGARLIVRGNETTFYTVGLWVGGEVRIEKAQDLSFSPMTSAHYGPTGVAHPLATAPFPVEIGKTYEVTVVADGATIYCYIDGKFVVLAQERDFTTHPFGRVGFFTRNATASFSDVSVKGLKGVTASPFTLFAGNPLDTVIYSPAVIKDDKFRMWGAPGRYAESEDGIAWIRHPNLEIGNGNWPSGGGLFDPDVMKVGGKYWMTFWTGTGRRNNGFDGMGIKRSDDGIHWTPEPANPVFYMGPYGDWDEVVVGDHAMIKDGDLFKMWHVGINRPQRGWRNEFGYAESPDGIHWRKCRLSPVLTQGEPGDWDGGWIYSAGIVKIDDEQTGGHVYAGKPGGSYHLFYTGQPSNDEFPSGVKRIGHAFSLDGINWVKWNDSNTAEPPFQNGDPVVSWPEYGQPGSLGVGACTAMRVGDEVRIYYSMYDDRSDIQPRPETVIGTGFARVKVEALRKIVADAKAKGLLKNASRKEIESTLEDILPQSTWDDLQGRVRAAVQAQQVGDKEGVKSALADIAVTRAKFTKALEHYYSVDLAPLKKIVDELMAGHPVTGKVLWSLPADASRKFQRERNKASLIEFADLNIPADDHPVMIEIEAKCNRFALARVAWATGGKFKAGQEMEFIAGYPGAESPTHRVTMNTDGEPITALRLQFPANAEVDLKQIRVVEFGSQKEEADKQTTNQYP